LQATPFMTTVALGGEFLVPNLAASLARIASTNPSADCRNRAGVCSKQVRKQGPSVLQDRFHLRQFIVGEWPVSEVAGQPQLEMAELNELHHDREPPH
jgi:hypothetical protein